MHGPSCFTSKDETADGGAVLPSIHESNQSLRETDSLKDKPVNKGTKKKPPLPGRPPFTTPNQMSSSKLSPDSPNKAT